MVEMLLQPGDPVEHRGIVITPLFPTCDPVAEYATLEEAVPLGLRVREVSASGSVPELLVENPLDRDVLLYDGEELIGAKQNRILNVSVLVAAGSTLPIPVSCVEQGRWQTRSEAFAPAPQVAHPSLRRRKAAALEGMPLARGRAQADVWDEVAVTSERFHVNSPTAANADVFRSRRGSLSELEPRFPLEPGQCGAVLALGASLCLDAVSRPDAFASLWPKLRAGYLLDALDRLDRPAASGDAVREFLAAVPQAALERQPSAGRGDDLRLSSVRVLGSGLELNGELLQLTAFPREGGGPRRAGRISRPTWR